MFDWLTSSSELVQYILCVCAWMNGGLLVILITIDQWSSSGLHDTDDIVKVTGSKVEVSQQWPQKSCKLYGLWTAEGIATKTYTKIHPTIGPRTDEVWRSWVWTQSHRKVFWRSTRDRSTVRRQHFDLVLCTFDFVSLQLFILRPTSLL